MEIKRDSYLEQLISYRFDGLHLLSIAEYYSAVGGDKNEAFDEYAFYGGIIQATIS